MEIINAQQAKKYADNKRGSTIEGVLLDIKYVAIKGNYQIMIYKPLDNIVLTALEKLGYEVGNMPEVAQQQDGNYHVISWKDA